MSGTRILRFPYIHDHHSHVSLYASFEGLPDLGDLGEMPAMRLLDCLPRDRLNLVTGWRTGRLPLDAKTISRLPPLIAVNASLHGYAISPSALPLISELWPELTEKVDDRSWGERNLPRLFAFYGRIAGLDAEKLLRYMTKMKTLGIGSLEDMTISGEEALALFLTSPYAERIVAWATPEIYRGLAQESRPKCAGVKVFLDGSLGAKSAALDEPYLDGTEGSLLYSDEELKDLLAELASYRVQLSAHALGHKAIAQALRCLGNLIRDGLDFPAVRLEHVQFITLEQARFCKESGMTLSMQPNFNSDSSDYADRLVPRHQAENDPFRMLIDEAGFVPGKDLVFGSDGMPHGLEHALRWSLFPNFAGQSLSIDEIEAGYGPARGNSGHAPRNGSAFTIDEAARDIRCVFSA